MSVLFLPLRSNCGWFATEDTHEELRRRLKNWLLFYDELAPEDGRYQATFGQSGSFDMRLPGKSLPDRRTINYREPGAQFSVMIGSEQSGDFHPILGGEAVASYEVDFFPVLAEAGITSEPYISWVDVELTADGKRFAQGSAKQALREMGEERADSYWLRQKVVQNLHADALLAASLGMPMSVDANASGIIDRGNIIVESEWAPEARAVVNRTWVKLGLPDAGSASWDVVLAARESASGQDLRRMIDRLSALAAEILLGGGSASDIEDAAGELLVAELVNELLKRRATATTAAVNFGLNLIPYAGFAGSANDVRKVVQEHRSWVALLGGLER